MSLSHSTQVYGGDEGRVGAAAPTLPSSQVHVEAYFFLRKAERFEKERNLLNITAVQTYLPLVRLLQTKLSVG
ncbi:MAG: hypothetical protein M1358_10865, partial [Chloroflexi bacterium]|nr:hypothetical protein [Chloroflexota bacterium]